MSRDRWKPIERELRKTVGPLIAGVDEVGRGPLAVKIRERAVCFGVGAASVREIDRINIYQATVVAMRRALTRLGVVPHHVLIDGKPFRTLQIAHTAIVGGDDACYTIACASIIAKVTRDRIMYALAGRYPNYRWDRNVGYATLAHIEGMAAHGVTPHHRRSFIPVRQLSLDFSSGPQSDIDLAELTKLLVDVSPIQDGPLSL